MVFTTFGLGVSRSLSLSVLLLPVIDLKGLNVLLFRVNLSLSLALSDPRSVLVKGMSLCTNYLPVSMLPSVSKALFADSPYQDF